MHAVLEGRDSLVVLPTGGGKSLCFQAPALVMEHAQADPAETDAVSGPAEAGHYDSTTADDEGAGYDFDWDALPVADPAARSARQSPAAGQPGRGRQGFALVVSPVSYTHLTLPTNREV